MYTHMYAYEYTHVCMYICLYIDIYLYMKLGFCAGSFSFFSSLSLLPFTKSMKYMYTLKISGYLCKPIYCTLVKNQYLTNVKNVSVVLYTLFSTKLKEASYSS